MEEDDDNAEIPEYFICPISLQIMKDPVTATSGITYDRHSIHQWLLHNNFCPVTKLPLPQTSPLTPNYTLSRLITAWSSSSTAALKSTTPLTVINILIRNLRDPDSQLESLCKLAALAAESERNRVYMAEAELATTLMSFVVACRRRKCANDGLEEALTILQVIKFNSKGGGLYVNDEIIDSLVWVLECCDCDCDERRRRRSVRSHAACALKAVVEKAKANPGIMQRLKPELFRSVSRNLRGGLVTEQGTKALLHVLLEAGTWGRNRAMMVESGTVSDLVEVELRCPEKRTTEMVLGIINRLCSCAEGRAQLLSHAAGIAVVTWRMLKVSAAADDRAVQIIWQISKYSATNGVVQEMLRVGTVGNLCLLMLADTSAHLKEKARNILRMHFHAWRFSPCIEMATLSP